MRQQAAAAQPAIPASASQYLAQGGSALVTGCFQSKAIEIAPVALRRSAALKRTSRQLLPLSRKCHPASRSAHPRRIGALDQNRPQSGKSSAAPEKGLCPRQAE